MDEMFTDKTPISYYEKLVFQLRKEGKKEDSDKLAFLIASIKYSRGEGLDP
jgi:hypothetical protein